MPKLTSKNSSISLRALEPADIENTLAWHNSNELYQNLGAPARFVSREIEIEWLKARCIPSKAEMNLAIIFAENGKHIGNIYLKEIDQISLRGELHVFIGDPAYRSKGCGSTAIKLLLRYAFFELNLQRITLEVLGDNKAAIACYEKQGFIREGVLRKHVFKNGSYRDIFYMAILREDYADTSA